MFSYGEDETLVVRTRILLNCGRVVAAAVSPVCGFACMCDATTRRRVAAAAVSPVGGFACMFVHDTRRRFRYVPDVIRTLATIVCCRCLRNFCLPSQLCVVCLYQFGLWVPRAAFGSRARCVHRRAMAIHPHYVVWRCMRCDVSAHSSTASVRALAFCEL